MKYKVQNTVVQKIKNKITIFDGEESILYTLNETATIVFEKIKRGVDSEKIIDFVAKEYQIEKDVAKKDVDELIRQLIQKKIILS